MQQIVDERSATQAEVTMATTTYSFVNDCFALQTTVLALFWAYSDPGHVWVGFGLRCCDVHLLDCRPSYHEETYPLLRYQVIIAGAVASTYAMLRKRKSAIVRRKCADADTLFHPRPVPLSTNSSHTLCMYGLISTISFNHM